MATFRVVPRTFIFDFEQVDPWRVQNNFWIQVGDGRWADRLPHSRDVDGATMHAVTDYRCLSQCDRRATAVNSAYRCTPTATHR